MDKNHNPEFTMLEFYCAYADVYDMLSLTEELVRKVFYSIKKSYTINFNQIEISLENKFDVLDF